MRLHVILIHDIVTKPEEASTASTTSTNRLTPTTKIGLKPVQIQNITKNYKNTVVGLLLAAGPTDFASLSRGKLQCTLHRLGGSRKVHLDSNSAQILAPELYSDRSPGRQTLLAVGLALQHHDLVHQH